ncbi:MAG: N-acetylmuramic acid 6-phosphate etherase [Verrucomicrobiales bacterium]|nr:N-acetylmuramic acid 6-phosphate etherase [Verrucomicrobiales bacterium]
MASISPGQKLFLGIECGATKSSAVLGDSSGKIIKEVSAGPGNLRLLDDRQLLTLFKSLKSSLGAGIRISTVAIGMAGARTEQDRRRILRCANQVWLHAICIATNDLETALAAAPPKPGFATRVLLVSGTGSCCFGTTSSGMSAKFGGWGHILGDKGSGYEIGLRGLKAVLYYFDKDGRWPALGASILNHLKLNEPDDLILWVQSASKADIADLAQLLFTAAIRKDKISMDILAGAAETLAKDACFCASRLASLNSRIQFVLTGSVLTRQPDFAKQVRKQILKNCPKAIVSILTQSGALGALRIALKTGGHTDKLSPETSPVSARTSSPIPPLSSTEDRNPASMDLHKMSPRVAIQLMLTEEAKVPYAVLSELERIVKATKWIVRAFKNNGRLFYVGAGTSGRLGILDASECPPTFRSDPEQVQGIIAGGVQAVYRAVEGAEDNYSAGQKGIFHRNITSSDVVVGIAASGRTPFVLGALSAARSAGAKTILVSFNSNLVLSNEEKVDLVICPKTGPEILTGSTRLKAGTATKLILNAFTTVAMVQTGKVVSNLMVDLNPSNLKLRDRARRIVSLLTHASSEQVESALTQSSWRIKAAIDQLSTSAPKN